MIDEKLLQDICIYAKQVAETQGVRIQIGLHQMGFRLDVDTDDDEWMNPQFINYSKIGTAKYPLQVFKDIIDTNVAAIKRAQIDDFARGS